MNRDEIIKYTPDGFQEVADSLTFLPEEMRVAVLTSTINILIQ